MLYVPSSYLRKYLDKMRECEVSICLWAMKNHSIQEKHSQAKKIHLKLMQCSIHLEAKTHGNVKMDNIHDINES